MDAEQNTTPTLVTVEQIRAATMDDIPGIKKLIDFYASRDMMLPRPLHELYPHLRDYLVFEEDGVIVGCVGLRVTWDGLAEIVSLAVATGHEKRGIGQALVKKAMDQAADLKMKRVFALTYVQAFFERIGFKPIDKIGLPHKVWNECTKCSKFAECDEVAVAFDFPEEE